MDVRFEIMDGPVATPWLSPDIEPGQMQNGSFTIIAATSTINALQAGHFYDFRVRVHNKGSDDAVPWSNNIATGDFVVPVNSNNNGLAWPLGSSRTIAQQAGTRVQLINNTGTFYMELQSATGTRIGPLGSLLSVNALGQSNQRLGYAYSPSGQRLVEFDFNDLSRGVGISVYTIPDGTKIIGPNIPAFTFIYLTNISFTSMMWSNSEYAGLNFGFSPDESSLLLAYPASIGNRLDILDLREKSLNANRHSISSLSLQNIGQHLFSPGGDLLALIPANITLGSQVQLYELPSGHPFPVTNNGISSSRIDLLNINTYKITVNNPAAYKGITLVGMRTLSGETQIDPPFRATCAVQVHLWVATPAGTLDETNPGNVKLPTNVNIQGASAYFSRIPHGQSAEVIVVSSYRAPSLGANDHRCAFAEAYSVQDVQPNQPKQRTSPFFNPMSFEQVAQRNFVITAPNSPFFIAPYTIANSSDKPLQTVLRVEAVDSTKIPALLPPKKKLKYKSMEVKGQGFIEYPCGRLIGRDEVKPLPNLQLTLQPGERFYYALLIDVVNEPDTKQLELAAFNIVEKRSDGTTGGVTVVAASNLDLIPSVTFQEPTTACPIGLVANMFWSETSFTPALGKANEIPEQKSGYLAGEFINQSAQAIDNVEIWIESHDIPGTRIEPLVFQSVRLKGGESIFAFWPITTGSFYHNNYRISIVAKSPKHTPHRILPYVTVKGGRIG